MTAETNQIGCGIIPVKVRTPVISSSVSPGSMNPMRRPVSMNTIAATMRSPQFPALSISAAGSNRPRAFIIQFLSIVRVEGLEPTRRSTGS